MKQFYANIFVPLIVIGLSMAFSFTNTAFAQTSSDKSVDSQRAGKENDSAESISPDLKSKGGSGNNGSSGNINAETKSRGSPPVPVNFRSSVRVDTKATGSSHGPAISSDGDLTAIVYVNYGTHESDTVYLAVSDGRGIDWSPPIRLDADTSVADKSTQSDSVAVLGDSIYVAWLDERYGSGNEELFFTFSHNRGVSWSGEVLIDKGYVPGTGAVREWRMRVTSDPDGGEDHIYFLLAVDPTAEADELLYLVASHSGGSEFSSPAHVPQNSKPIPLTVDVDRIAMAAEGVNVSVIWQDNRNYPAFDEVWFQQSPDGGTTWRFADVGLQTVPRATTDANGNISIAQSGSTIVAAWQEDRTSSTIEEIRANISFDMGITWMQNDILVGGYIPGVDDVDSVEVFISQASPVGSAILPVIAWDDNRTGKDEVYAAVSTDDGLTWTETKVSSTGGSFPVFAGGDDVVGLSWTSGSFPTTVHSTCSLDSGITWMSGFEVSGRTGFDAPSGRIAYNPLYTNFVCTWLSDAAGLDNVYAGGYRPQTLVPAGSFTEGSQVHFRIDHWPNNLELLIGDPLFRVLISSGTGDYTLPDGRNTGLLLDNLLEATIFQFPYSFTGSILLRSGTTPVIPFPGPAVVPPGTVLHCVAVGYDALETPAIVSPVKLVAPPPEAPVKLGKMTDTVEVFVQ